MQNSVFKMGKYNTHFIEDHKEELLDKFRCNIECEDVAILAAFVDYIDAIENAGPTRPQGPRGNLWKEFGRRKSILRL